MEIRTDATVSFPRELVFTTYRDRLVELLPYLPNLRGLEIKSREERDGDIVIVNDFKGGSEIPAAVRSFLSESMLSWSDHATWKQAGWICNWQTKVHAFPGAILSSGYNRFVEVPGGTRIEFRGELTADASKVPGVPKLLARSLNGTVEKIFVGKIVENLVEVGNGIGKLLEKEKR